MLPMLSFSVSKNNVRRVETCRQVLKLCLVYSLSQTCPVSWSLLLGLPDDASKEAASWVEPDNDRTVLIDASTAFRVNEDWVYGFPGKRGF